MGTQTSTTAFIDELLAADEESLNTPAPTPTVTFTIKLFVLRGLLEKANSVVPTRDVMPVLKCFQIDATPGQLRVVATDTELSVIARTEMVTVTDAGTVVFPARKILEILREAADTTVTVTVRDGVAAITIGRTRWELKLLPGDDYPTMATLHNVTYHDVDRHTFAAALHLVKYAACHDPNRASLKMIDIRGSRMTACDGARFQQAALPDFPLDMRIPIDAVDDLLQLMRGTDLDTISIGESVNDLIFVIGHDVFLAKKLHAQFPDMEAQLLRPALDNSHRLTIDRTELLAALKRVRINADQTTSAVGLHLHPGKLTVIARDTHKNNAVETVDAGWEGPERTLVVNHVYLSDLLRANDQGSVTLMLGDDLKSRKAPLLLRDEATGAVGVLHQMVADWVGV